MKEEERFIEIDRFTSSPGSHDAHVEDYRIRQLNTPDGELEMTILMRFFGDEGTFYLRGISDFTSGGNHYVTIRRSEGEVVDEFNIGKTTADPGEFTDAVQEMCELFVAAVDDWYAYALDVEQSGGDE